MIQRAGDSPLWAIGIFPRLIEVDARTVRAGGRVVFTPSGYRADFGVVAMPEDIDRFAREWLEFRGVAK